MARNDGLAHGSGSGRSGAAGPARGHRMTRWLDRGAVGLSLLCLVHCLALPLVIMALPAVGALVPPRWWVHPAIFALAVPMAAIALIRGWRDHRDPRPIILGGLGLALLGLGLFAAEASAGDVVLTVLGGSVIAFAHLLNWRLGDHGQVAT